MGRGAMHWRTCMGLLFAVSLPLAAQTSGKQLRDFAAESEAFNGNDPMANSFRAGYYNGYVNGIVDALQGRSVCFSECRCELDKLVAKHLATHPEAVDQPAARWLVPLLETAYPCR